MKVIIASNNKGKIKEYKQILEPMGYEVLSQSEAGIDIEVPETGTTYEENAKLKAYGIYDYIEDKAKTAVLADDSGLSIDFFDGGPGLYTARFKPGLTQEEKNNYILDEMKNENDRSAKFICCICFIKENGEEIIVQGECKGSITRKITSNAGFGYDPIFIPEGYDVTFSEITGEEKNKISHRGKAISLLKERLILSEANYCLGCKARPCSKACPMHTGIPEVIAKVKESKFKEAYDILIENNLFSHVCSLVCPQEDQCQGSCVRGVKGEPTKIGRIEKFVNEWAFENDIKPEIKVSNESSKKVALIGSGPASLSCSYELAKRGIKSTIFEKEDILGGILVYGIPDFRLDKKIIDRIIDVLKNMGVEFKLDAELGKNISIHDLKEEYDYVFVGIGAEKPSIYKLSDENLQNVYDSDEFLKAYNYHKPINKLGKVVVIGGGNVAMDTARAAVHMGAKEVSILYRRDREHMPAREIELEEALLDGVKFKELTRVESANSENGKIKSVHCVKTKIVDGKAVDTDEEFDYEADTVVFAIGLKPNKELLFSQNLRLTEFGTIEVDENGQTSIENVFAGGDVVDNKSVVCKALASGKKAALSIIEKAK